MIDKRSTERFSNTVEHYVKYRPSYPKEVIDLLVTECGLKPQSIVADIGSGTGKLTQLLLEHRCIIYAVEPNLEMRIAAEKILSKNQNFHSVNGQAEHTSLANQSVDLITVGQAFHWFDHLKAKAEFKRILRPASAVALIWNLRDNKKSKFMQAYEQLLQEFGTDYEHMAAERVEIERIQEFFAPAPVHETIFSNRQVFDWEGLKGRLLSTSYTPKPGQPRHEEMFKAARSMFDLYQQQGVVELIYITKIHHGQLT